MAPNELGQFTTTNPPTEEKFREIGKFLTAELSRKFGDPVEILDEHIEKSCWITSQVFRGDRDDPRGICYYGIVSYSLRETDPSVTSVLLKFSNGNRVTDGRKSILASKCTQSGWEEFAWIDDEFGEWDCEHLSEIAVIKRAFG